MYKRSYFYIVCLLIIIEGVVTQTGSCVAEDITLLVDTKAKVPVDIPVVVIGTFHGEGEHKAYGSVVISTDPNNSSFYCEGMTSGQFSPTETINLRLSATCKLYNVTTEATYSVRTYTVVNSKTRSFCNFNINVTPKPEYQLQERISRIKTPQIHSNDIIKSWLQRKISLRSE